VAANIPSSRQTPARQQPPDQRMSETITIRKEEDVNQRVGAISQPSRGVMVQFVALITGLSLALGAFVALGGLPGIGSATQSPRSQPVTASASVPTWQDPYVVQVLYYIVDSEAEALSVELSIAESAAEQMQFGRTWATGDACRGAWVDVCYTLIRADTAEGLLAAEYLAAASSEIADHWGAVVSVIDVREE
jgi:hypothetical protein